MTPGGTIGTVLDRALTPGLLDVALRIATKHARDPERRHLLGVALRDHVTRQEAANKTQKILARVWVAPPPNARQMIGWAISHQHEVADQRGLHYGALLATFPFFGSIVGAVGRQLRIGDYADRESIRNHARTTFGARAYIDAGAAKSLQTLRHLELLGGPTDGPYLVERRASVPMEFSRWFLHALMLTRRIASLDVRELSRAPELAFVDLDPSPCDYPLLELHVENGRTVAEIRAN